MSWGLGLGIISYLVDNGFTSIPFEMFSEPGRKGS